MAWTTPKDWAVDEMLTASKLNTHLRDNLNALKSPPSDSYVVNEGSDYSPSGTSYEDIDATNLALTITPAGTEIMVHFHGTFFTTAGSVNLFLDLDIGGSAVGGNDGIVSHYVGTTNAAVSFTRLITGLTAGQEITIKMRWKCGATTLKMAAGAGTSNRDVHGQFWAREMS